MPLLTVITASTRPGRVGPQVTDWFVSQARHHGGFKVETVDLAQLNLPFLDEPHHPSERNYLHQHTKQWSATIEAADAFGFVLPEYNSGFNAPLKNAIDYLYHEWRYKPVALISYGMSSAGLRAAQMVKQVVTSLAMLPVATGVAIPLRQHLDAQGNLHTGPDLDRAATRTLDELLWVTPALASLR